MASSLQSKWICLRLNDAIIKRHVLVLSEYADLKYLGFEKYKFFEYVIFQFCNDPHLCKIIENNYNYCMQIFKAPADNMCDIRHNIKRAFKTPVLGHMCVLSNKPPMYSFLKEWFLLPHYKVVSLKSESLTWGFPHVVVFDLDSTLITEEEQIQIRDSFVYDSLQELHEMGCVLVLWSYGSRDHVAHSMRDADLEGYFDIIISEGSTVREERSDLVQNSHNAIVDYNLKKRFIENKFVFDIHNHRSDNNIPKSPKIVIKYLSDKNVNFFKSITLVDDLPTNNYAYDFYVKVKRCPTPVRDWHNYHEQIIDNLIEYDNMYNF
ncbi:38K [Bombyx mori nucleopolyhedrovirus]|uniref:38K n=1 Tax=Bombyx mori nuclear polyhedrosis virus TaxID=271108 RepID=O92459_NPVBM|nr:38K [Bombyx mori nucleopolyhedrovirus]AAC63768.1 38K [Bombyx mori nucleopolyhedrovirus]AIS92818.1 38K [Bombyx mori nucleopolyhedrovirus]QXI73275.1 38K [Bombyx mori nucleopolyhedrovirus]